MYIVHTLAVGYIVNRAKVQFQLVQIFFQLPVLLSSKVDDKGAQHTYKAHHRIKKKCLMTKSMIDNGRLTGENAQNYYNCRSPNAFKNQSSV